jgi:tRNA (guanine37-N1)-methyltransferase
LRNRAVVQALEGLFSDEEIGKAIGGMDIIGDLAVIKLPKGWEDQGHRIGERLMQRLGHIKGVFRQTSPACGGERLRGLEWLAGRRETQTTHREHGCSFRLDLATVYFSPRLSNERLRIAGLVTKGEVLVNMFAGVGTFSIIAARKAAPRSVYSIDMNQDAFRYMEENVKLNGVEGVVLPVLGDSKEAVERLEGVANRVLMPLPELAYDYLPYGLRCLNGRGWIHVYAHQKAASRRLAIEAVRESISEKIEGAGGLSLKGVSARIVRSVGRRMYQVVADVEVGV